MSNETLRETLLFQPKHGYERLTPAQKEEMESYCKDYAAFMDAAKTEREAVTYTVAAAEKAGFRPLTPGMTLKAGTIIATGTPAGVGMGFDPPRFLKPGDVVECMIEGIGTLKNPVVE